ncbi:MAG: DUF2785 domain-containing protein [Pseudomonadota bacterium]
MHKLLTLSFALTMHGVATAACPPRAQLQELREAKFVVADGAKRQVLALALQDCLGERDPFVRDEVAFAALSSWMRGAALEAHTLRRLRVTQLARLGVRDSDGFAQPFAALALSEVARTDRIKPYLSEAERAELVQAGSAYLSAERDYRGYDAKDGWRHGVPHGADLMRQLAANPLVGKKAQQQILAAVAAQVMGASAHTPTQSFHSFEGDRLANPVFALATRSDFDAAEWDAWFSSLAITPAERSGDAVALVARMHNLSAFLMPLYVTLSETKDLAARERMLPAVAKALRQAK